MPTPKQPRTRDRRQRSAGFTMVELLVALAILLVGMAGLLALASTAIRSSAFSRHLTEAVVLAEDKMEALRTVPITGLADGQEIVDAQGIVDPTALFTRAWTLLPDATPGLGTLTITVNWSEQGSEPHSVLFRTKRVL